MKKILLSLIIGISTFISLAQTPDSLGTNSLLISRSEFNSMNMIDTVFVDWSLYNRVKIDSVSIKYPNSFVKYNNGAPISLDTNSLNQQNIFVRYYSFSPSNYWAEINFGQSNGIKNWIITLVFRYNMVISDYKTISFVFNNLTSSLDDLIKSDFKIYPNPTSDIINLDLNNNSNSDFEIYDISGKLLIKTNEKSIDLSNLSPSIYLLKVGNTIKKFQKI
ncbi:MAG: T9SS type A sorting domain-containing protein [Crocinitomicaceae bacterium]|nr:T9SS type A sorting domain-containing protein [Crocinitomicaceae bacterium]